MVNIYPVSRLSNYGNYRKLVDLFEAIPSTVKVVKDWRGVVWVWLITSHETPGSSDLVSRPN